MLIAPLLTTKLVKPRAPEIPTALAMAVARYQVVDDLMPNNDDGTPNEASWEEAMRRYKALRDQQRANRKRAKAERDAPPPPECCSFCGEPKSANRAR